MKKPRPGGRTTPKGTRPSYLHPVDGGSDRSPADDLVRSAGRELLGLDDPVQAETWASGLLEAFDQAGRKARHDGLEVPPFLDAVLGACRRNGDGYAAVVAAALGAVAPPPHGPLAAALASELAAKVGRLPAWTTAVGRAVPHRAWVAADVFGDQESLLTEFRSEGWPGAHVLVALVDHNLSGQAKDAWVAPAPAEDLLSSWLERPEPHMRVEELPVQAALGRLRDAMLTSDFWDGDDDLRTEEFAQHRALVWSRLRRAGLDAPPGPTGPPEVAEDERQELVARFLASPATGGLAERWSAVDIELLAHHVVDLRSDYEGRPLRWSPTVVSVLLGDLAPRKLIVDREQASAFPDVVRAFIRFAAGQTGLGPSFVQEVLASADEMEPVFLERIGDPAAAGPAKALLSALRARGVDLGDPAAIRAALQDEHPVVLPAPRPERRRGPAPDDVVVSAGQAPVLSRFDALARYYGTGRKLTQTGQPTLADARDLVAALGTSDRFDAKIGDRTFRTRSAAELPELAFMLRWAVAAGVLRKEHGRLRATVAWHKLEAKPLGRWLKSVDVLASLGPLAAYHAQSRYRGQGEVLDDLAPGVLGLLVERPLPFEEVLDWVCGTADQTYEWLAPYMQDPEHRRSSFNWDLGLLARILGWAGVVERRGARTEPGRYGDETVVGGVLGLTPAGRWWLVGR